MAAPHHSLYRALMAMGDSPTKARRSPIGRMVAVLFTHDDGRPSKMYRGIIENVTMKGGVEQVKVKFTDGDVQWYTVSEFTEMTENGEIRSVP
jgi:hypothetical protein